MLTGKLVLGTMTFGSQVGETEAARMVDRCLEAGITMFDTANAYNGGASEEILGRVLAGRRNEVSLATKAFNRMGDGPDDQGLAPAAIGKAIDASLRRLNTDHVDLYYLHQPDWSTPIEQTLQALDDLVQAGKVRVPAASNYAAWQLCEMVALAQRHGWTPIRVSQQRYNLLNRRLEAKYAAFSQRFGVTDIVYNPLAGGLLTGKHRADSRPAAGSRFAQQAYRDRYWNEVHFAAVAELAAVAEEAGLTLPELAFRWLLSRPLVDAVLLGASTLAQLDANLAACDGPAPDEETVRACDAVWERWLRGAAPAYNR